jgi:hypothetical protein
MRNGIGIVVGDIHNHIQAQAAVGGDGVIHGSIQDWNKWLHVRAIAAGTQPNPG